MRLTQSTLQYKAEMIRKCALLLTRLDRRLSSFERENSLVEDPKRRRLHLHPSRRNRFRYNCGQGHNRYCSNRSRTHCCRLRPSILVGVY